MKKNINLQSMNLSTFFNLLSPILLNGINFITMPIFTRMLGTDNYGYFTIYTTWLQFLTIFVGYQVSAAIGNGALCFRKEEHDSFYSSGIGLAIVSSILVGVFYFLILPGLSDFSELPSSILMIMIAHAFGVVGVNFAVAKFTYFKQGYKSVGISISVTLIGIALSLALISSITNSTKLYYGRVIGYAIPNIVIGVVMMLYFLLKGKTLYKKEYWSFYITYCTPLLFHSVSQIILSQSDKVMLQKSMGQSAVGIYGFTVTFVNILNIIYNALNTTWVPFYHDDMTAQSYDKYRRKQKNYVWMFTIICAGFVLLSPEVIKILGSKDYWNGIQFVPCMVLSNFVIFLYSFPVNHQFLYRKTTVIAGGTCITAVLNVCLNAILIPRFGMLGAALGTLLAYVGLFVIHSIFAIFIVKGKHPYIFPWKNVFVSSIFLGIIIVIFYATQSLWWLRWLIGGIIGMTLLCQMIRRKSIF